MDWFGILLIVTTAVRGLGAGMIYDVALVSLPARHRFGVMQYTDYVRAHFETYGLRTYGPVSIVGAALTVVVAVGSVGWTSSAVVRWALIGAVAATVLAFVGTARALPAVLKLRRGTSDLAAVEGLLDRFAFWHTFAAVWQVVAFVGMTVALGAH